MCWSTTYKKTYCPTKCFTGPRPEEGLMWSWWDCWPMYLKKSYDTARVDLKKAYCEAVLWQVFPPSVTLKKTFAKGWLSGLALKKAYWVRLFVSPRPWRWLIVKLCASRTKILKKICGGVYFFLVSVAPREAFVAKTVIHAKALRRASCEVDLVNFGLITSFWEGTSVFQHRLGRFCWIVTARVLSEFWS